MEKDSTRGLDRVTGGLMMETCSMPPVLHSWPGLQGLPCSVGFSCHGSSLGPCRPSSPCPWFHRARLCRRLNTRHPAEGKRQANQENQAKP
jgi:hypothetical protein